MKLFIVDDLRLSGGAAATTANPFAAQVLPKMGKKSVREHRCGEREGRRERGGVWGGSMASQPITQFFFE
ncbi:hypothetical protein HanRHA438_Chr01g0035011 [Helianthus annuus]|nr:hypothetical protein HanRHA438_Chr01g0035011 [Helianthus annuus]